MLVNRSSAFSLTLSWITARQQWCDIFFPSVWNDRERRVNKSVRRNEHTVCWLFWNSSASCRLRRAGSGGVEHLIPHNICGRGLYCQTTVLVVSFFLWRFFPLYSSIIILILCSRPPQFVISFVGRIKARLVHSSESNETECIPCSRTLIFHDSIRLETLRCTLSHSPKSIIIKKEETHK